MLALLVLLAAAPSVRYLENKDGVLRAMEHVHGSKTDVELARASQKCAVERSAWSAKAERVLVTSKCALVLLELDRKGAKSFPFPASGPVVRTQLEFATDGAVLAFVEFTAEVRAFEWKSNAWVELEKGEPTQGLDSIDGLAFQDLKSRARLFRSEASLHPIVGPGDTTGESRREPTADEVKLLPKLEAGFSWELHGDATQTWAGTIAGTDACFQSPPVVVRVGTKWKTVLAKGDCVRGVRRGGWLLIDPSEGSVVLVSLATGEREELSGGFHHVLVGDGPTFVQ